MMSTKGSKYVEEYNKLMVKQAWTAVAQWLRCCATNRMVAGSIPDIVIRNFYCHNSSNRTMALGVDSASNRFEYQEHFLGVKAASA